MTDEAVHVENVVIDEVFLHHEELVCADGVEVMSIQLLLHLLRNHSLIEELKHAFVVVLN